MTCVPPAPCSKQAMLYFSLSLNHRKDKCHYSRGMDQTFETFVHKGKISGPVGSHKEIGRVMIPLTGDKFSESIFLVRTYK